MFTSQFSKAELALAQPISLGAGFRAKQEASPLLKEELQALPKSGSW